MKKKTFKITNFINQLSHYVVFEVTTSRLMALALIALCELFPDARPEELRPLAVL